MLEAAIDRISKLPCFSKPTNVEILTGGISNLNFKVTDIGQQFMVRLAKDVPEHGVMRWNELELSKAAAALNVSPEVTYHDKGILVFRYIDARTLTAREVQDTRNLKRIVDLVAVVHNGLGAHLMTPVLTFWPYQVNQVYARKLEQAGSNYSGILPELMAAQSDLMEATGPVHLVTSHNDLLAANLLDDGSRLWLVDWEHGGYNTPLFDLAGLAGNNSLSEVHEHFLLEQYFGLSAEQHWRAYRSMKCVSFLRETLWSMTSEIYSTIDFDYAEYTRKNLECFRNTLHDFYTS